MDKENDFIVVFAGNTVEADFVKMLLEANDIEAFLKDEHMGHIAPFYVAPAGAGAVKVLVSREDAPTAEQIIQDYLEKDNS